MKKGVAITVVLLVLLAVIYFTIQVKRSVSEKFALIDSALKRRPGNDNLDQADTTGLDSGIFLYLQRSYQRTTPRTMIERTRSGINWDIGIPEFAELSQDAFKNVISFYKDNKDKDLAAFTNTSDRLQYEVNTAILCSYAYEQTGERVKAIEVLRQFLANSEAWKSRIHERFILLCVDLYGKDHVMREIKNCGNTLHDHVVTVCKADMSVNGDVDSVKSFLLKMIP